MHPDSAKRRSVPKSRLGAWLPTSEAALAEFRQELGVHVRARRMGGVLFPVVQELADLINDDPFLRMYFTQAIHEAIEGGYHLGYSSVEELITLINGVMTYAPPFSLSDMVGCPLNALLDWPMCMPSGFPLFRSTALNAQLKKVLNFWAGYLSSSESRIYLNDQPPTGWFCPEAITRIKLDQFDYDPNLSFGGFPSWNDFFIRRFKPGVRPIAGAGDSKVIVNACESTPYNMQNGVQLQDAFWIKSQLYSLRDIFTPSRLAWAERFVGGSIYQAFLSAYEYHRWHAPVSGTIVDAYLVEGTYYSDVDSEGIDPSGPNDSQGYLSAVATRAVIIIHCDDPTLQNVACVFIGMSEISSCVITPPIGRHVEKGGELGYFQYGGSTHCLIFEQGVIDHFVPQPPFEPHAQPMLVNSKLAVAK